MPKRPREAVGVPGVPHVLHGGSAAVLDPGAELNRLLAVAMGDSPGLTAGACTGVLMALRTRARARRAAAEAELAYYDQVINAGGL